MLPDDAAEGMYGDDSPAAAFATTPGNSALTLIRCSGRGAIETFSSVFARPAGAKKITDIPGNSVVHGWIVLNGSEKIDEVLVSVFRAPKSYTGEDSLDICCHGGLSAGKAVMDALKHAGFRGALPGEFTFRAFMNGKLDLTRCESVMEIVRARTDTSRRRAVSRLGGFLETEINEIKKMLVEILSGAEICLDYSEDEISPGDEDGGLSGQDTALQAFQRLKKLSASWQLERIYQEGITAVIAGRPNAGKSSLFNAMLKEERSIVTEAPGTTRDWIEAWVSVQGIPVRLIDTAGLRESADSAEKMGVERSRKLLLEADIVLYLIDGENGVTDEDRIFCAECAGNLLVVWNKADIAPAPLNTAAFPERQLQAIKPVITSAKTGSGLEELYGAIVSAVQDRLPDIPGDCAIALGTERQKNLVDTACRALEEALSLAGNDEPLDLIAPLLREAVNALGEITGEVSTADILEDMFSRFCVGK